MSPTSYQTAPPRGVEVRLAALATPSNRRPVHQPRRTRRYPPAMRWFRRRPTPLAIEGTSTALVPRSERALVALAVHAQQLSDRVDRLERRVEENEQASVVIPTTED